MHMKFLASDELQGRNTGEPGHAIAARYLAVQAGHLGLESAGSGEGYLQPFLIEERGYDFDNSRITVIREGGEQSVHSEPFFLIPGPRSDELEIEGEVVFAGYGIREESHGYNDFEGVDLEGKVVLIMNRAPMNEEGTANRFGDDKWNNMQNFQHKLPGIMEQRPKAVLLVLDPKSGFNSIEEMNPGISNYLGKSRSLKEEDQKDENRPGRSGPSIALVHRTVADALVAPSGKTLKELQLEIDRELKPNSFEIEGTKLHLEARMSSTDLEVSNVFGFIEGSDPGLKNEMVIYVAHYDHVGTDGKGGVFNGADDNASGTVALLEMAEAFMQEKKSPGRSVGFLWVAAEEIGLFGSRYFADHPMVPLEQIAAVINLDMVARTRSPEDAESGRRGLTIVGGDTVKVIGGLQSEVLMELNRQSLEEMGMAGNYRYNDITHPERYFYRSDHINFARKDIPVLFYSTGTHRDYHLVTDTEGRLDYDKFLKMTRFCYKAGYNVAQYDGAITVDNPMSSW